ncbi:MAG: amidohydrolase family protein, partial [Gemmatimonadota bacterium]
MVRRGGLYGLPRATTAGVVLAGWLLLVAGCAAEAPVAADLVLRNGVVVTVDDAIPDGEAIAVAGDTILAVGSDSAIAQYIGPQTEVIDLEGRLAIPGFIESHGHFLGVGDAKMQLDLMGVANWDEIVEMVATAVDEVPAGALIRGRGWHQEKWDREPPGNVEGLPTHETLSA